jgi:hypothetical protein
VSWAATVLDSTRAAYAQGALNRLGYNPAEYGWNAALYSRYIHYLATRGVTVNPILPDSLARDLASASTALSGLGAITVGAMGFYPATPFELRVCEVSPHRCGCC